MPHQPLDATITIGHHHLRAAGLDPLQDAAAAVDAVRRAVESMDGADWIDVESADYPPSCPGWVIVYPRGCGRTPDTLEWREQRRRVEEITTAALVAASVPFIIARRYT